MKNLYRIFFLLVFLCSFALIYSDISVAAVNLPWSTTYDCADWVQGRAPNCDGITSYGSWTCSSGQGEEITSVANNPNGGGGKGQRHWVGDNVNSNSGGTKVIFSSAQKELWMRWYVRYQAGFKWQNLNYDKLLYFFSDASTSAVAGPQSFNTGRVWTNSNSYNSTNYGWDQIMVNGGDDGNGHKTSDGQFHCWEVHMKVNTGSNSDGIVQIWIDGVLKVDRSDAYYTDNHTGMNEVVIGSNQNDPDNGGCYYVDYDDIAISNIGYIGPISGGGSDTIPPSVSISSPTSGQTVSGNVAISASAFDNVGVSGVQFKLDGADIGAEDTTSPYSISWDTTTVSDGSYTFTATARDAAGNQTTSTPVDVTISNGGGGSDTIPPSVSITAPTGGQTVSGTIAVSATASDNVGVAGVQFKLDGADLGTEDTTSPYSITWNTTTVSDGSHTLTTTARDAAGNQTTSNLVNVTISNGGGSGALLFEESFEDADFASRGWYDNTNLQLSTAEHISGSNSSVEYHFLQGATKPISGGATRKKFTDTDTIYVSYYVKYSSNWEGSNKSYHPHEFLILSNLDRDWDGPAYNYLTTYIEQNEGEPLVAIQDGKNIDEGNIGVDLTGVTENRAVAGCNGDSDGYGDGSCYSMGSVHWNGKQWKAGSVYFQDTPGQYYKNDWHFIEAYLKLNTISGGVGIADGVIKYWYDGNLIIDHNDVILRTGQHPNMKFNQFIIAPWIGDGSPVDQTFWIDNLTVATATSIPLLPPSAPTNVHMVQP